VREISQFPFPADVPWSYPPEANRIAKKRKRGINFLRIIRDFKSFQR